MDHILIEQLELETIIGVHAWERQTARRVLVDLDLGLDFATAAASDHLRDAVNYKNVCDDVAALLKEQRYQLLEALAEAISRRLFQNHPILTLKLKLSKPGAVPATRNIAVRIERRREDYVTCGR